MLRYSLALFLTTLFAAASVEPALAARAGALYSSPDAAQATCPSEEVVWLEIERMKYVHKDSADYGKREGAYACLATAHAKSYQEVKETAPSQ